MPRYALLLSYDGAGFAGFWRQNERRTVGAVVDEALGRLGEHHQAEPAARTDAGVHARGQVAHVDLVRDWDPANLHRALDHHLPPDCACLATARVPPSWHAARDAGGKTYVYQLECSAQRDPLRAARCWRPPAGLHLSRLVRAGRLITACNDFRAFARRGDHREDHHCRIATLRWEEAGDLLRCRIRADRFTYRLVRSLVGAMVAHATDGCSEDDLATALAGDESPATHHQAPAHGLVLEAVHYRDELRWAHELEPQRVR